MILKAPGLSVTQQLLVVDDRAKLGDGQNPFQVQQKAKETNM